MNKIRLAILADFLDSVPPKKFNLESWRDSESNDSPFANRSDEALLDPACGTTGCAIGHACVIPELKAEGLSWQDNPQYMRYSSWLAVQRFFEISDEVSQVLFSDSKYHASERSPGHVAERIRTYLNEVSDQ
jgi:hypothetical protein